jgi:hypothetical protein
VEPARLRRTFHVVVLIAALAIAALQMFRVRGGWFTDYGADVFGTAWLYSMVREGRTVFSRRVAPAGRTAWIIGIACGLSEIGQRAGFVPGVFDPLDLAAFAATVAACYALDRRIPLADDDLPVNHLRDRAS